MGAEEPHAGSEVQESYLPFILQAAVLLLLSLHALAVGVWGLAFFKDLHREGGRERALTSAELNRRERERRYAERLRSGFAEKVE